MNIVIDDESADDPSALFSHSAAKRLDSSKARRIEQALAPLRESISLRVGPASILRVRPELRENFIS